MATTILLLNDDLTRNSILGGNIDVDRYLQDIKHAQNTYIKPLLGSDLYNKIVTDFENATLTGLYNTLYEDYVKELLIHSSAEIYLSHGAYMVSNNGITKLKSDSSEAVSKEEVDYLVESSRKLYKLYEREFFKWINLNPLPEYPVESTPSTRRLNIGGWSLRRSNNC
jgi:hypothetical protein